MLNNKKLNNLIVLVVDKIFRLNRLIVVIVQDEIVNNNKQEHEIDKKLLRKD